MAISKDKFIGWLRFRDSEEPPVVKKREVDLLRGQQKEIEDFLSLRLDRPHLEELALAVRDCFTSWQTLMTLQEENEWAKRVLSAYEQQGKIRDLLEKTRAFADGMDGDAETARQMGYSKYLFYLRHQVTDLQDKGSGSRPKRSPPPAMTADNVVRFIRTECAGAASLSGLPRARETADELLKQLQVGGPKTKLDDKRLGEVSIAMDLLNSYSQEELSWLDDLRSGIDGRAAAMRKNIRRGSALFAALTGVMSDAWFDAFDPETEDSPVKTMALPQLQAFYQEKLAEVQRELEGIS